MSPATDPKPFTDWLQGHATPLSHLDPAAPLDDLEPLRDILDGARVVALGEHSHFIDEFATMRRRTLRFLVERCGVTVLAFEYGFSEGFPSTPGPTARERTTTFPSTSRQRSRWESKNRSASSAGSTRKPCRRSRAR
jgi:erythromycin esterase-like protein